MVAVYALLGVSSTFDNDQALVTSPLFSPLTLGFIRLALAVYTFTTCVVVVTWEGVNAHSTRNFGYFSYFTDLSYIGLCAYFWASSVQTLAFASRREKSYPLQGWPRVFQFLHVLLYSTVTTFPIIVTVVYWVLLSSNSFATRYTTWSNISQHAFNTVFALFEILLTYGGPNPWSHLPFLVIILALYLGVAYITHATQGFYTYDFLNPEKEGAVLAGYIVGIAVGEIIVFTLTRYLMVFRNWLAARLGKGRIQQRRASIKSEDWEEVERPGSRSMSL
ncbi:hypothetical protein JAAARDRAFT_42703 [Jaapia argillacea MUCL 33604]|uniref:FAR-17a/AIG1-like protein n=1 Tax=Jaapia argillacea MUCL 33604 TaxID=933084 RepID=A0A067P4A8_9AGAM|nr:hypothetical protein JAAARDRAFT_42703 [Jaapia argillacea MUCL 33604]